MRRVAALAVLLSTFAMGSASADPFFTIEGTVNLPNPGSKVIGGITEVLNPCGAEDPDLGDLNGVDGFWIELPEEHGAAELVSTGVDMDVWWYDGGCGLINDEADPIAYDMATDLTANEAGGIPLTAAYAIVDLAVGAAASFKFTITRRVG